MNTEFDKISAHLKQLEVPIAASEAHGLLCGLLCCLPSSVAKTRWFAELLDAGTLSPDSLSLKAADVKALDSWFARVVESLNDSEFGFVPLAPDDDTPLASRVTALGDFCAGFTYGVGIGVTGRGNQPLPENTTELIHDFNEIDSSDLSNIDGSDESSLVELSEYVRVGVLLMYEELQPVNTTNKQVH